MNQTDNTILAKAKEMNPSISKTGIITPKDWRLATRMLGYKLNNNFLTTLNKVAHGRYQLNGEKVDKVPAEISIKPTKKPAKTLPQVETVDFAIQPKVSKAFFTGVPERDKNYVPFGNYRDVEQIMKSRKFFPFIVTGMSGNGKSCMVIESCARHNIPLIRYSVTSTTGMEELIGHKTLSDGNIVIVEGPVLIAMRLGIPVLLDELDAAQANNIMCLQGILEGKSFYFSLTNEIITPAPGFNLIGSCNTKGRGSDDGRYIGTNIQNDAFLERFPVTFEQDYPTESIELKMLLNWMESSGCTNQKIAENLAKWATAIRKTFADGGLDDLISTRRLKHIVETYSIFGDIKKAVNLATNRFDQNTAEAFRVVFDKIHDFEEPPAAPIVN